MKTDQNAIDYIAAYAVSVRASKLIDSQTVPSPCVSVCVMNETSGLCEGCLRTIDEIRLWGNADAAFKRIVWANIEARAAQYPS